MYSSLSQVLCSIHPLESILPIRRRQGRVFFSTFLNCSWSICSSKWSEDCLAHGLISQYYFYKRFFFWKKIQKNFTFVVVFGLENEINDHKNYNLPSNIGEINKISFVGIFSSCIDEFLTDAKFFTVYIWFL